VSVPGVGGMGYHWLNPTLVDDVFDPLQPEVVLYATGSDGELKLVAIEYIVIDVGQGRPEFAGYEFDIRVTSNMRIKRGSSTATSNRRVFQAITRSVVTMAAILTCLIIGQQPPLRVLKLIAQGSVRCARGHPRTHANDSR
jgi:hypothetical protein